MSEEKARVKKYLSPLTQAIKTYVEAEIQLQQYPTLPGTKKEQEMALDALEAEITYLRREFVLAEQEEE